MRQFDINIDTSTMDELVAHFGSRATARAINITRSYAKKIQSEARTMLQEKGRISSGQLVQSIQPEVSESGGIVQGQVNAAAPHARFIHEGAMHDGSQIVPHFVSFAVAPSLQRWAKLNRVIYQKQGRWYFKGKSGKEHSINIEKGGMMVKQDPVPYFRVPFETLCPEYFEKIKEILQ